MNLRHQTITHVLLVGMVTVTPALTSIGPALIALLPAVIAYVDPIVAECSRIPDTTIALFRFADVAETVPPF